MPASAHEIRAAIESLTAEELLRMRQFAVWRWRALGNNAGRDHEDLLQEAVARTVAGDRLWNERSVSFTTHLIGAMRSISSHWAAELAGRSPVEIDAAGGNLIETLPSPTVGPEMELAAKQEIEAIERLLADDAAALRLLDCIRRGMSGPETQQATGYSKTEYETVMKRMRRKLRGAGARGAN